MSETEPARLAPRAPAAVLTEQVNLLVDHETRAFLIGSKILDNARSEASVARTLIGKAIDAYESSHPDDYAQRVTSGYAELALRAERAA
jgi:hypothetical protein